MSKTQERICRGLLWIAEEKGYSCGWVSHTFRERCDEWPANEWLDLTPIEPSNALRAFVNRKSKNFAKRARKRDRRNELQNGAPRKRSPLAACYSHMRSIMQEQG